MNFPWRLAKTRIPNKSRLGRMGRRGPTTAFSVPFISKYILGPKSGLETEKQVWTAREETRNPEERNRPPCYRHVCPVDANGAAILPQPSALKLCTERGKGFLVFTHEKNSSKILHELLTFVPMWPRGLAWSIHASLSRSVSWSSARLSKRNAGRANLN